MKISYDWRGMPVEFKLQNSENSSDSTRLTMMYDGSGRRVAKTRARKAAGATEWETELVTHYTGIGTEVRDQFHNNILDKVKVVVNMPQGLGRYGVEENSDSYVALGENDDPNAVFEWYLKNHLGSTMLVYGTQSVSQVGMADFGIEKAAYDYRAFGEQMSIVEPADKVTENFTGKELDDEIALNYFGARYLDPMLGLWISVDAAGQFSNPYTYAGNNPIIVVDPDGNVGVVGGVVGVAEGIAVNYIQSAITGSTFKYTAADLISDFVSGCTGLGLVQKGLKLGKAIKLYKQANTIRKTKPITYKKSGAVATKHKWANRAENMEKEAMDNIKDVAKDFIPDPQGLAADHIAKNFEDVTLLGGDSNPSDAMRSGDVNAPMAPADNTSTQLEFDK